MFHPYYKVFAWLTFFTVAEIVWAMPEGMPRWLLIGEIGLFAQIGGQVVKLRFGRDAALDTLGR